MDELKFAWSARKDSANHRKHSVGFEEAKTVFYDELARLIPDPDHSEGEERFVLLGYSYQIRLLLVCHCYKEDEHVIRIISARKADKAERKQYEGK